MTKVYFRVGAILFSVFVYSCVMPPEPGEVKDNLSDTSQDRTIMLPCNQHFEGFECSGTGYSISSGVITSEMEENYKPKEFKVIPNANSYYMGVITYKESICEGGKIK